ncbi:MAG: hypothetical protein ABJB76_05175 [Candidatus Nitrosocosmicus sp.]
MMGDKLVPKYNQILRSLLDGKSTVNKLYEKTGLKKNNETMDIKEDLKKAGLISEKNNKKIKDKNFHSQSHIIELSDFGHSFAFFLKQLDEFEKHFNIFLNKVDNKIGKYFNNLQGVSLKAEDKKKLQREGWNENDIKYYSFLVTGLHEFKIYILSSAIEVVSYRYGYFIIKFNPNTIAKELIKKIVGDKIMQYIFLKMDIIANPPYRNKPNSNEEKSNDEEEKSKYKINKMYENYTYNFVETINHAREEDLLFNEHISKEIKNLMNCLKSLSGLKREHVEIEIDVLYSNIEELNSTGMDKNNEDYKVLTLYNELFPET